MSDPVSTGGIPDSPRPDQRGGYRQFGRIVGNEILGTHAWLTVEVPGWRGARPGQFALVQTETSGCFLPRALSVGDELGDRVSFLVAPVGAGTRELSQLRNGDGLWILGPLGNGFDVEVLATNFSRTVIVAGGVGVAPFPLLLSRLAEQRRVSSSEMRNKSAAGAPEDGGKEILVLLGFRDAVQSEAAKPVREAAGRLGEIGLTCRLEVATEDGSKGPAEKVTDLLRRYLRLGDRVAACGPWAMAGEVWRVCSAVQDVEAWFSLEANMACGLGSCHGCLVTLADGSAARVCRDGPVFAGREVFGG